jgi:tRNA modification GTPase
MAHMIAAAATGWVRSGIGILRMSGDGCLETAGRVFRADSGKPLSGLPDRRLTLGTLFDREGRVIDRCMATVSRAPHSYTGEDTAEFQCHGSPAVLAAGLEALFAAGARQAERGEFTKRAFLNGQLDLTQAEAVIDLIDAESPDAAANAAGQLGGAMLRRVGPIYDSLVDLCSHFHAVLDYPDEEIEPFEQAELAGTLRDAEASLSALLATFERGRHLKNGIRAVILGSPNAGKSSLLNALAGYDRVIVTEIAGTTRDSVEETVTLGKNTLRLVDTAGIRETGDRIERLGVERAEQAAGEAELAIFVCDAARPLTDADRRAIGDAKKAPQSVALLNKSDLPAVVSAAELPFEHVLCVSAKEGTGLDALAALVDELFGSGAPCDGSILTNARQAGAVSRAIEAISQARASLEAGMTPDAVLLDAEAAMAALGEITGRTVREDITNRIFERFCVGK